MKKSASTGNSGLRRLRAPVLAALFAALAAVSTAFASRLISSKVVFMCRPEDAVRAGWDVSSLATNRFGLVQLEGCCHTMVSDDCAQGPKPKGVVSSFLLCSYTNITWNAATQRLERGSVWFTKGE